MHRDCIQIKEYWSIDGVIYWVWGVILREDGKTFVSTLNRQIEVTPDTVFIFNLS